MNRLKALPNHSLNLLLTLLTLVTLTACSEGGIGGTGGTALPPVSETVQPALAAAGTNEAYTNYMVNSLSVWGGLDESSSTFETDIVSPLPTTVNTATPEAAPEGSFTDLAFSADSSLRAGTTTDTNLVVAGVDEIDAAKYNGKHLFLANHDRLTVIEADGINQPTQLANLHLPGKLSTISGLYLYETVATNVLAAIRGSNHFAFFDRLSILPHFGVNETVIDLVDVATPGAPAPLSQFTIEGNLIESRRVDQHLLLITRFSPNIEGFQTFASDEKSRDANQAALDEATITDLVPTVTQDGVAVPLTDVSRCLLPTGDAIAPEFPTITTVSAIDLETRTIAFSACLADSVTGIHMTTDALYIASPSTDDSKSYYSNTSIHRFDRSGNVFDYVGTGTVQGTFWGDPKFLMGEVDGSLAAITTVQNDDEDNRFTHRLTVLAPSATDPVLDVRGTIPNDTRPESIGKPNEQIFASRFFGDKAYVVTFEQIDPVYALDLSDPTDPFITGELEIPGFSSYLHPISDSLLLGVGSNTRTEDGFIFNDGVNVRLFDVGTPGSVTLLDEESFGRQFSYTPVSFDHHAFSLQQRDDGTIRFTLPVTRYGSHLTDEQSQENRGIVWTDNALQMMTLDTNAASPTLSRSGQITAENHTTGERFQPGCCGWQARSFFNNETLLFLNKNRLFAADWTSPNSASSTFIQTLFANADTPPDACTTFVPDPLSIAVFDSVTGEYLNCGLSIQTDPDEEELSLIAPEPEACQTPEVTTEPKISGAGSYSVSVTLQDYLPITVTDVRIQENECHVGTTHLGLFMKQ